MATSGSSQSRLRWRSSFLLTPCSAAKTNAVAPSRSHGDLAHSGRPGWPKRVRFTRYCFPRLQTDALQHTRPVIHRATQPLMHLAVAQRGGVELSLGRSGCGAGEDAVELCAVEGDQQQIDPGIEHLHHRGTDIALIDRTHHQIVGHDHSLVIPFLANDSVDDEPGMRCRAIRIDGCQCYMSDHQLRLRAGQHLPEGNPVGRFELLQRRIQVGTEMMGIGPDASQSGKMLDRRPDTGRLEPAYIRPRDIGDRRRIIGNRALTDQRVEIEPVALQCPVADPAPAPGSG